ncbi:SDR family NAD(P)-dependent oxidoreductase [Pseudooctadecabacter jejudonensis]|uniref:(S)-1-Phenylethanol dehydrogenase n=1 Tax=Pseudooctadecabacter jejudonensis TaxID=1391910 RepID=A0A1Y5SJW6_9RHOB|nr:SDR family oxidoreductase [Pseudooctadecabacter jejudonensis]SLN41858.1 (S)-1-Phenylethanol dehydrogenase [Pseudooctadecabacter jejudonensis]
MDFNIETRRALVTGSTAGIGYATARTLLKEGATVILTSRTEERANDARDRLLKETDAAPEKVEIAFGDLATSKGAEAVVSQLRANGLPDILINNVGFFEVKPIDELEDEDWTDMFEINVMSGVRLTKALFPHMAEQGWGRVVFVASEQSLKPNPEMMHYAMTKTAQVSVARSFAELGKDHGVTVNSVLVAPTWSEGVEVFLERVAADAGKTVPEMREAYFTEGDGTSSIIARFADVKEIAAQIAFLSSDQASAITGAAQRVDGGIVRSLF